MKIRINIDGTTAAAVLDDNAVARDLSSLLPLSLTLADYADSEKIAYLPRKLSTKDAPAGSDASVGDIAYYAPWGNLAIFYKARPVCERACPPRTTDVRCGTADRKPAAEGHHRTDVVMLLAEPSRLAHLFATFPHYGITTLLMNSVHKRFRFAPTNQTEADHLYSYLRQRTFFLE